MSRRITAWLLCLLLCVLPVFAGNVPEPEEAGSPSPERLFPVPEGCDPRQRAIAEAWQLLKPALGDQPVYAAEPSVSEPYAIGTLSGPYLDTGLQYLNFLRGLAGLEPAALSDHLCVQAQYGSVLLAANDSLTHTPEKPAGMESSFYRMGANACASSNLSMRFGYQHDTLLQNALQGHMDEDSPLNRLHLGHRRWLLEPRLGKTGFGLATSSTGKQYITVPVSDSTGSGSVPAEVCWPAAGPFPNNVFSPGTPWSVSLDPAVYRTPDETRLQVTVTRLSDGAVFTPATLDGQAQLNREGTYLLVSSHAYGTGLCISFSIGRGALGAGCYLGDYTVSIAGLQTRDGVETTLAYTVRFFDAEGPSAPSVWALEEVLRAGELGLVPDDLTDLYQRPVTRLEFCRLAMQTLRQATGLDNAGLLDAFALPGPAPVFSDCADPEVLAAAAIGAVRGMGDGTFRPGGSITRQDAAVLLWQTACAASLDTSVSGSLLYADGALIAPYARSAVQWASQVRDAVSGSPVMAGVGGGAFDPLGPYTREQAVLTALRLFRWAAVMSPGS